MLLKVLRHEPSVESFPAQIEAGEHCLLHARGQRAQSEAHAEAVGRLWHSTFRESPLLAGSWVGV